MLRQLFFITLLFCFLFLNQIKGQDPIFSQFYAAPLQLNPAFAGNTYAPFVTINYRNQWTGFNNFKTYVTYAASFSQFIEGMNSGLGLMVQADDAGDGIYKNNRISAVYSYKIQVNDELVVKFGVEAAAIQNRLDWDKLIFPDQVDPTGETNASSQEVRPENLTKNYFDLSTGILVYSKQFYGGLTVKHMNTPDESILGINGNINNGLPTRLSIHGGAQIELRAGNKRTAGAFISPNMMYVKQGDFSQINAGAYLSFGAFFAGGWYRQASSNGDSIIGLAGFQKGILKIGYSYDFTISGLAGAVGSTHEFSLIINLDQNRPRRTNYNDCFEMFR